MSSSSRCCTCTSLTTCPGSPTGRFSSTSKLPPHFMAWNSKRAVNLVHWLWRYRTKCRIVLFVALPLDCIYHWYIFNRFLHWFLVAPIHCAPVEGVFYRLMFWSDIQRYFVPPSISCKEHSTIGRMTLPGHIDASLSSLVRINFIFRRTIFDIIQTRWGWSGCLFAYIFGVTVRVAAKLDIFSYVEKNI